ncbi:hypothetical protein FXF53_17970 [Micromonospora sp. WP24]|uniref:hypothetical protein n=1 Tax=Micromonospora sp. WP24 TaxID=2604469 RepID=UPI0011D637E9|nr:hypothetical protein [Micromonospora sp. WP24]TYB98390.1 hypothetical protein FXF53_17970 [Micromonospora sp. WP24]
MSLEEHPGFLGFTSRGVMLIHANWPAYPFEHGWEVAVTSLGSFPFGAQFERIDDIDRCALFLARGYGKYKDPRDEGAFHVAIWHEDLLEAHDLGLVDGVERLTHRGYETRRREELRARLLHDIEREGGKPLPGDILSSLYAEIGGRKVPLELPPLEDYDDGDDDITPYRPWLGIDGSGTVRLTSQGWNRLESLWADALDIPERARPRVDPMIERGLYDSALRELGVLIESRVRELTPSSSRLVGFKLIDSFIKNLDQSNCLHNAGLKILRSELRTAFSFVRNEFAHNVVDLPKPRAYALLGRMCYVLMEVDEVAAELDQ